MSDLELLVKNPSKHANGDFRLRVPQSATVGEVKARLQAEYPGSPERGTITVIYAGRVLKQDEAPLATFLHQNVDPTAPHTLHVVIKPAAEVAASASSSAAAPADAPAQGQVPAAQSHSTQRWDRTHIPPNPLPPAAAAAMAAAGGVAGSPQPPAATHVGGASSASSGHVPPAARFESGQVPGLAGAGFASAMPGISAPVQGYAYTIPSPYAYYNPALSAAYTAALQALQAATAPVQPAAAAAAAAGPSAAAAPQVPGPAADRHVAFNAALESLQRAYVPAGQPPGAPGVAGAPAASGAAAGSAAATPGSAAEGAAGQPGQQPAGAAAAAPGANGLLAMPPIALPMAQFAYVPAFIPIPQPVLTAIPHPQAAQQGAAAGQEQQQQEGQQGQPAMIQGIQPVGQFIPVGPFGQVVQPPMQVHVVEAVPGEPGGIRRRRVDVNQPGALPPEVVEALRAAQQRGQLPGNLANMVAQLQRQQAARRAERAAQRARGGGFQIQINLGRINMRAIMQLLFMLVIMAPYFSLRRLAMMLGIAALLNLARLEGVRRALNRMAGQLELPLQQEGGAAGAGGAGGGGQAAVPGAAGAAPGAAPMAGQQQQQQEGGVGAAGAEGAPQAAAGGEGVPGAAAREPGAPGAEAAAAAGGAGAVGGAPQRRRAGLLREVQALVVGFITSLLPGWNVNPEDAAAFAAAEEMMAAEQEAGR